MTHPYRTAMCCSACGDSELGPWTRDPARGEMLCELCADVVGHMRRWREVIAVQRGEGNAFAQAALQHLEALARYRPG